MRREDAGVLGRRATEVNTTLEVPNSTAQRPHRQEKRGSQIIARRSKPGQDPELLFPFLRCRCVSELIRGSQLFSATSLREATKGIALNRAIYVFTAVTVIYTPLGFVSVRTLEETDLVSREGTAITSGTGSLGIAHSEYNCTRGEHLSVLANFHRHFRWCARSDIHYLWRPSLVLHV